VHRAQRTAKYEVGRLISLLGDAPLDAITPADVERCVRVFGETIAPASVNRLRDRLSGMFKRAKRLGLVTANPVKDIPKLREAGGRLAFLSSVGEEMVLGALPVERRPLVILAANTGLRWSEQAGLEWRDVDILTGVVTVRLGKNGQARRVPLNSVARCALMDLSAHRRRPSDPAEPVCRAAYRDPPPGVCEGCPGRAGNAESRRSGSRGNPSRRHDVARAQAHVRFSSRLRWGRLADGPRAWWLEDLEHGAAVRPPVARALGGCGRADSSSSWGPGYS